MVLLKYSCSILVRMIFVSKYDPLRAFLEQQNKPCIRLSFRDIEGIIGSKLPASAYTYRAWWANDHTHTHARNGWLAAGYKVRYVDLEGGVVEFVKEGMAVEPKRESSTKALPSFNLSKAVREAKEFEDFARMVMSEYFGVRLEKRRKPGWPKEFDLVSPDYRIVGDAKSYTMVKGKYPPPAKFATISEHVWMLENIDAEVKFLVFGNDKRVPLEWLKRYGRMVKTVKFYFVNNKGQVEELP